MVAVSYLKKGLHVKSYDLQILNQRFTIRSDADEKHVKKVSDYVNKKIHEIVTANKAIATSNVAVLTALNIADDFFRKTEENKGQVLKWSAKIEELISRVEKG